MSETRPETLSGVAETLLMTLYIRAMESQRPDALIKDERAVAHPGPVGVVIDEDTALVLKESVAEVIGAGNVALVDPAKDKVKPYLVLKAGDQRDIAK
jgi:hypothetical protein